MKWSMVPASRFSEHEEGWNAINGSGARTPLLDARFVGPLIDEFGNPGDSLLIGSEMGTPKAMALLRRRGIGVWSTFQPSQAPIGLWISDPNIPIQELARETLRSLPGVNGILAITQQDPNLQIRPKNGGRVRTLDYIDTARITVDSSFESYWADRGKNLRHNLKRQRNKLRKEGVEARLEAISATSDIATAVAEYGILESSGWKSTRGTSVHADNAQGRFYRCILESFSRSGESRVYRYRYNERTVAMDLCLVSSKCLIILKTTYDESEKTTSPAMLMRQEICREIFDGKEVEVIEFYGSVMDWHKRWTKELRTIYHLNCYRWSALASLHQTHIQCRRRFGSDRAKRKGNLAEVEEYA